MDTMRELARSASKEELESLIAEYSEQDAAFRTIALGTLFGAVDDELEALREAVQLEILKVGEKNGFLSEDACWNVGHVLDLGNDAGHRRLQRSEFAEAFRLLDYVVSKTTELILNSQDDGLLGLTLAEAVRELGNLGEVAAGSEEAGALLQEYVELALGGGREFSADGILEAAVPLADEDSAQALIAAAEELDRQQHRSARSLRGKLQEQVRSRRASSVAKTVPGKR